MKTCVKCEVSLCVEHVKEHLERPAFADHPLVKPLRDISKRKCPVHRDQVVRRHGGQAGRYICNLCILESNHQNQTKLVSNVLRTQLQVSSVQNWGCFTFGLKGGGGRGGGGERRNWIFLFFTM